MAGWYSGAQAAIDEEMPPIAVACDGAIARLLNGDPSGPDARELARRASGVQAVNETITKLLGRVPWHVIADLEHYRDTRLSPDNPFRLPAGDIERHIDIARRWVR